MMSMVLMMIIIIIIVIRIHICIYLFITCAPGCMAESGDPRRQVTCLNKAKASKTLFKGCEMLTF